MTATVTDTKLIDEIHDVNDDIAHQFLDVVFHLTIASTLIADEATRYDYCQAVENLLTALGAQGDITFEEAMGDRPESTDDRPLYQRLATDSLVEQTTQVAMNKLGVLTVTYAAFAGKKLGEDAGYATYERVYNAVDAFGVALGLPHEGDDDEQHPAVKRNPLNDFIKDINAKVAEAKDDQDA